MRLRLRRGSGAGAEGDKHRPDFDGVAVGQRDRINADRDVGIAADDVFAR